LIFYTASGQCTTCTREMSLNISFFFDTVVGFDSSLCSLYIFDIFRKEK
jgi:hypothetical protein